MLNPYDRHENMKRSRAFALVLAVASPLLSTACDDDDPKRVDGGTDARLDGSSDQSGDRPVDGSPTGPDAGDGGGPDLAPMQEAGAETLSGDGADGPVRGVSNTWFTLRGGDITAIQPAVGILGGNIVVAGGRNDAQDHTSALRETRFFAIPASDVGTVTVQNGPALNTARWGAAFAVAGGRLFAIGGTEDGLFCMKTSESLDAVTGTWRNETFELPEGLCGATATAFGSLIFVTGGSISAVPGIFPPMPAAAATCVLDTAALASGWRCDLTTGDDVAATRRINGASGSNGTIALIVGGLDPMAAPLGSTESLTQSAGNPAFSAAASLPGPRMLPGVAAANGQFYVLGGSMAGNPTAAGTATLYRAATAAGPWNELASAQNARVGHVLIAGRCSGCATDRLYAIGGHSAGPNVADIEEYTP
jgi:hypothetical protein